MVMYANSGIYLPRFKSLYRRFKHDIHQPMLIDHDEVEEILSEYDLNVNGLPKLPNLMGRSTSLVVNTYMGKALLKRYKSSVQVPAVLYEHSILAHLAEVDFPAPRLFYTQSGETFVRRGGNIFALFKFMEGYIQYRNYIFFPKQVRYFMSAAGETLAILHESLKDCYTEGYNPNGFKSMYGDRWRNIDWYIDRLAQCIEQIRNQNVVTNKASVVATMLLKRADWLNDTLLQLDQILKRAKLPRQIIHGDYSPNNVLLKLNSPVVVLDFEIARLDWRITDLARSISSFAFNRLGYHPQKMEYLLKGYVSRYPMTIDELHLIPIVWQFLLLRRIIACWHHSCTMQSDHWDEEIAYHLKRIDWITKNQDNLRNQLFAVHGSS